MSSLDPNTIYIDHTGKFHNIELVNGQLKVTSFDSSGNEGTVINGVQYIAGKSGVDSITNTLQTIDYAHHEVHGGSSFYYKDWYALLKNGTKEFLLVTPDTAEYAHFSYSIESVTSTVVAEIFEGATTSSDGTLEPARNRNRNVADDNTTLLYEDPTLLTDGTEIKGQILGAGRNSAGGLSRDDQEIVLKRNTKYLIRITEQNIDATSINIDLNWYEHTDKN